MSKKWYVHPYFDSDGYFITSQAVELQVDDDDNEDSYVGNQLGDRTVVGSDAIPSYASDKDIMDTAARSNNDANSEPSGSEWEQDKNESETSDEDKDVDAHDGEDNEIVDGGDDCEEEDLMDIDRAARNRRPKPNVCSVFMLLL